MTEHKVPFSHKLCIFDRFVGFWYTSILHICFCESMPTQPMLDKIGSSSFNLYVYYGVNILPNTMLTVVDCNSTVVLCQNRVKSYGCCSMPTQFISLQVVNIHPKSVPVTVGQLPSKYHACSGGVKLFQLLGMMLRTHVHVNSMLPVITTTQTPHKEMYD